MKRLDASGLAPLPGVPASLLGESPVWHPDDGALWWCDIPGRRLNRWHAASGAHRHWELPTEPGCIAPLAGGDWLVAMRDGLWRFDPANGERTLISAAAGQRASCRTSRCSGWRSASAP